MHAETEIGGRKFALYSLHLPGYAHHRKQPTSSAAWEGSKHKKLAELIKAEDASYGIIVGGDFNEWTDGLVMRSFSEETKMKNATREKSIDHIRFSTKGAVKGIESKREWEAKNQNDRKLKAERCRSDDP